MHAVAGQAVTAAAKRAFDADSNEGMLPDTLRASSLTAQAGPQEDEEEVFAIGSDAEEPSKSRSCDSHSSSFSGSRSYSERRDGEKSPTPDSLACSAEWERREVSLEL